MPPIPTPETTMPEALLEVRNLSTHFITDDGVVRAVDGVSLSVMPGKTLCVVGESGCGKSVMARSILQLVDRPGRIVGGEMIFRPEAGKAVDLAALRPGSRALRDIAGRDIAMIFQEPMTALSSLYTLGNQMVEAIRLHMAIGKAEARAMAVEALGKVGIPRPEERIDAYTFQLSGGMRQRAMIALSMLLKPKLLIADEPTTALDVTTQANILDLMNGLQAEMGMALMFITHDLGVVAEIADEVAVMYLGKVVERGPVEAIFEAPAHPYTQALLRSLPERTSRRGARLAAIRGNVPSPRNRPTGCPFHDRCDFALEGTCDGQLPPLTALGRGHEAACFAYGGAAAKPVLSPIQVPAGADAALDRVAGEKLIEVSDLKVHFPISRGAFGRVTGHVRAVDGVSFALQEGETLALVGESGSGKTSLGQTLLRLNAPTGGAIRYFGRQGNVTDLATLSHGEMRPIYRDIRMVFQDPSSSLNPRLPVIEVVGEVLRRSDGLNGRALADRVVSLLERVGLGADALHRYPHAFSGGQRQRIGIARALAPGPRLIVLDEAVSALDVSVRAQILNLLMDLQAELGLTYLFISHDLGVVSHLSNRVAVMYAGRLVELAKTEALFTRPRHPYTAALLSALLPADPGPRRRADRVRLKGEVADPSKTYPGCPFAERCGHVQSRCHTDVPPLRQTVGGGLAACHFADELRFAGMPTPETPLDQGPS